jgi:hypothetical protein
MARPTKKQSKKGKGEKIVGGKLQPKKLPKPKKPKAKAPTQPKAAKAACTCVYGHDFCDPVKNTPEANRTATIILGVYFAAVIIFVIVAAWIGFGGL